MTRATSKPEAAAAFPVEDFVQALIHQLDNVQDALALKVRTGRPLTWALKDLDLQLKVFVSLRPDGVVTLRSAEANEAGASTLNLALSTITRPMVEENTYNYVEDPDARGIEEAEDLSDDQKRRLKWAGVKTVGQLKAVTSHDGSKAVHATTGIPVGDLMAALVASSRPKVQGHSVEDAPQGHKVVRIRGANLYDGVNPDVRFEGEAVEVLSAKPHELVVRPRAHHTEGQIEVLTGRGGRATGYFRIDDGSPVSTSATSPGASPAPDVVDPYAGFPSEEKSA